MQQSIKEASRFVVGAAVLRAMTIKAMNKTESEVDFSSVAAPALRDNDTAQQLRASIEKLADLESEWFRNTPPHTLTSPKVMQSRQIEADAYIAIGAATLAVVVNGKHHDGMDDVLEDHFVTAYQAIDQLTGSVASKRDIKLHFEGEVMRAATDTEHIRGVLNSSESKYLDAYANNILSRYDEALDRSSDFDM